ncbi:MAG: bifunctional methylenetetrahydrofolate dehydrogenase/methenyltetrahydrofolate cyclohydrolase FolD [Myxococcales bacterium]|nr:bifunctional methylenetetrahydrofolate dehydrogenase/methenyltetrahydrofolate cyclohydrolase FolD [Myxococcales bacterium]
MSAKILDGKKLAETVRGEVKEGVLAFVKRFGRAPGLHVILVGDDPASAVYTRNKEKASKEVGMNGELHRLPAETSEAELLALIARLNDDASVDGILVQLPLPKSIREMAVLDAVSPAKDVDGFHPQNAGLLASGRPALVPCTPRGSMRLIRESGAKLAGAHAVVVGRSNIVGKPMAQLLLAEHATVTIAHSRTSDLASVCRSADVLVAAVGKAELIRGSMIKPGAIVIDVGINRVPAEEPGKTKLVGDVAFAEAKEVAGAITPVPGGVGPMTIACLLENTLRAAWLREGVTP